MHRVYEIIEILPSGSPQTVSVVSGVEFAKVALQGLAKRTSNECFAADVKTRQVVMQLNIPPAKLRAVKRVFQVSYEEQVDTERAELLRSLGYGVISVIGNETAKVLLSSVQPYGLFIVGHGAAQGTRTEIVDWSRAYYPTVKILALNPPNQSVPGADYNVPQNEPEKWLPVISQELRRSADNLGSHETTVNAA